MTKYSAIPVTVDGMRFASKAEARRYGQLQLLLRAGLIAGLECQPRFPLLVNGVKVGTYVADFRYVDEHDQVVIEDVKGGEATKTAVYRLKRKLVLACHGVDVTEVQA